MDALSLATNGIITPSGEGIITLKITRAYYPLKIIRIDNIRPFINVSPITKSIKINVKCKGN